MIDFNDCQVYKLEPVYVPEAPPYPHLWRVYSLGNNIYFEPWKIERETPRGCWVSSPYHGGQKLVIHTRKKRWAYPTKREAWIAWKYRLRSRRRYAEQELERIAELEKLTANVDGEFMQEADE